MPVELRLQLLFSLLLVFSQIAAFMVIIRSIGTMGHALSRLEQLISQEGDLAFKEKSSERQVELQMKQNETERARRNEILANIPGMVRSGLPSDQEGKGDGAKG